MKKDITLLERLNYVFGNDKDISEASEKEIKEFNANNPVKFL